MDNVKQPNSFSNKEERSCNVSLVAAEIVSNQVEPRSLFCPFCAAEYLFEFSLKDHLKRKHSQELAKKSTNELPESEQAEDDHLCPYCSAVFYVKVLIPKHIFHHHGRNWLQHYQQNYNTEITIEKDNDPTIMYASCSPGLSDVFEKLMTKDFHSTDNLEDLYTDSPKLKSILKKTPNRSYNPILGSPSSASIRRYRSELVKCSLSARRELRFDLPPVQKSPPQVIRKHKKFLDLLRLFRFRKSTNNKTAKNSPIKKFKKKYDKYINLNNGTATMITSTPVNFLDDDTLEDFTHVVDSYEIKENYNGRETTNGKLKDNRKFRNQPLVFSAERFQCGCCEEKYISNTDLLIHLKEKHYKTKCFLKKHYKCGQCGQKFFRNRLLIRHNLVHNTPEKI